MSHAVALLACAMLLTACNGGPKGNTNDFGAAQTARSTVAADRICEAAGFEDLQSCADSPDRDTRLAAKIALDMTSDYRHLCADEIGRDRCDDMLMSAYLTASKTASP